MNKVLRITRGQKIAVGVMLLCAISAVSWAGIDAMAQIKKKSGGPAVTGMTRYLASSRMYKMEMKNPNNPASVVMMDIPLTDVESIRVVEPKNYKELVKKVELEQYASAAPALEAMQKDYLMLEWDVKAAALLVEVYVKLKQYSKAASTCREMLKINPDVLREGRFFMYYAEALMAEGKDAILTDLINEVIATGPRPSVAEAHVIRGDMLMKKGDFKLALIDGYLRNIVLFEDEKASLPRALSKAIKCFEQLGENNNAEMMRKKLKQDFPGYEGDK